MEPEVGQVVRSESARQSIILIFSLAGTLLSVWFVRELNDPDAVKLFKMRTSLAIKRWADKQAERFSKLATTMANIYNGEKL